MSKDEEDVRLAGDSDPAAGLEPDWESLSIRKGDNLPHWTCRRGVYHVVFREREYRAQVDYVWTNPARAGILAPHWRLDPGTGGAC